MLVTSSRLRRLKRVERMSFRRAAAFFGSLSVQTRARESRAPYRELLHYPTAAYPARSMRSPRNALGIPTLMSIDWPDQGAPRSFRLRASPLAHGEEQLPVFAGTRDGRPAQRDQDIQDIQRQESGGDVSGALRCGEHLLRRHAARSADAPVHVIYGGLVDQVEVAGTTTRPR